jgi:hypothetical protein
VSGSLPFGSWDDIDPIRPQLAATMHRDLGQIGCVLRPGSVRNADQALRVFGPFLIHTAPPILTVAEVSRAPHRGIQTLAARPGRTRATVSANTIAHRLGTLRMFFIRIEEWQWAEAPGAGPDRHW